VCILLDRTIAISRRFLSGSKLPSFTSFNKHVEFLAKNPRVLDALHDEYQKKLASCLEWYRIPVKVLRDKYLMHSSEKHMMFFGWGESKWDLGMATIISAKPNQDKMFNNIKVIEFIPRQLARDIEGFLKWFATYWNRKQSVSKK